MKHLLLVLSLALPLVASASVPAVASDGDGRPGIFTPEDPGFECPPGPNPC